MRLSLLCKIIEEEVEQNGVDIRIGVCIKDLAFDQLDGPDAAATVFEVDRQYMHGRPCVSAHA